MLFALGANVVSWAREKPTNCIAFDFDEWYLQDRRKANIIHSCVIVGENAASPRSVESTLLNGSKTNAANVEFQ